MKKIITTTILTALASSNLFAQNIGMGTSTPNASAKLEITSTNSGLLIPRVALTMTTAAGPITAPATSLLVYNTATVADVTPGYYYWTGTAWTRLLNSTSAGWNLTGNAATNAATNFIGTTDAVDFVTRTNNTEKMRVTSAGNVGVGISAPTQKLDVQGGNARINNTFIGDVGHGANWAGFAHFSQASTNGYSLLASSDGSYTLINKLNTGGGYIGFRVGNTDQAVITNSGNMGIGTTSPSYRLDLSNGTFAFGNSNVRTETRDNAGLQGNAGAQSGFFETSAPVNYPAGATSWWHLIDSRHSNNGNNYALQIAGSFFDQELWFRKTNGSATQAWTKILTSTNGWSTTGNSGTVAATNFIGTIDAVDFVTRTGNVERVRVSSNGNVGIGTASPTAKLDVVGKIYSTGSAAECSAQDRTTGIQYTMYGTGGLMKLWRADYGDIMNFNSSGYVGIGITSPANKVDIASATRTGTHGSGLPFYVTGTILANANGFEFRHDNGSQGIGLGFNTIYATGSNAAQDLGLASRGTGNLNYSTNGLQRMIILGSNGFVGIGTTAPISKLHVAAGNIEMSDNGDNVILSRNTAQAKNHQLIGTYMGWDQGGIYLGGYNVNNAAGVYANATRIYCGGPTGSLPISATAFTVVSSKRFKQNIVPVAYGLNTVMQLRPVQYNYIFEKEQQVHLGLIAEEVNTLIPEVVVKQDAEGKETTDPNGTAMGVNYTDLTPVLIKAIQEQQTMIDAQKQLIDEQMKLLQELKKEVETLKQK